MDNRSEVRELDLFAEQGLSIVVHILRPGTGTDQALQLLASWAATREAQAGVGSLRPAGTDHGASGSP